MLRALVDSRSHPEAHLHVGVIGHQLNQQGGRRGQETTVQDLRAEEELVKWQHGIYQLKITQIPNIS